MPAPINYTTGFVNPSDSIQQMLQMGGQLAQLGQFRDHRIASQQATEDTRIAAEQKAARDAEIKGLYEQAIANPTWENYNKLAMLDPANSERIIKTWGMVDTEQQQTALNESMRIFAGLTSGDPKAGLNLLEERRNAALNAKDKDSAKKYQAMIDMYNSGDKGPGMVAVTFGTTISGMPGGKDAMDAYAKYIETKQSQDLAALKDPSGGRIYDPKDAAEAENSLRKEYDGRQKGFMQIRDYYDRINLAEDTGIGDISLIFTYMKILDPTSVVREGEVATTSTAGGVPSAIMSAYNKALGTGKIDEKVRDEIKSQSKKIFEQAGQQVEKDKAFYTDIARRRGLNVENIIYKEPDNETERVADLTPMRTFLKTKWPGEAAKIDSLGLAGLQREYAKTLAGYQPAATTPAAGSKPVQKTTEVNF